MKADFNSIREELQKLTDVEYLKKELSRAANEIKNFDVEKLNLSPENKAKLKTLEKRFNEIVKRVRALEKQIEPEVNKLVAMIKKHGKEAEAKIREYTAARKAGSSKKKSKKKKAKKS